MLVTIGGGDLDKYISRRWFVTQFNSSISDRRELIRLNMLALYLAVTIVSSSIKDLAYNFELMDFTFQIQNKKAFQ